MKRGTKALIWTVIVAALVTTGALLYLELPREQSPLKLTSAELEWLEENAKSIRIAPLPDAPPFDYTEASGRHAGITADYLRIIEQQLGITFIQVNCGSWKEIMDKVKNGNIDVVGSVQNTPERRNVFRFTKPYLTIPTVILTRNTWTETFDIDDMHDMSVVVVEDTAIHEYIETRHPEYDLIPVRDAASGIRMVSFLSLIHI